MCPELPDPHVKKTQCPGDTACGPLVSSKIARRVGVFILGQASGKVGTTP